MRRIAVLESRPLGERRMEVTSEAGSFGTLVNVNYDAVDQVRIMAYEFSSSSPGPPSPDVTAPARLSSSMRKT